MSTAISRTRVGAVAALAAALLTLIAAVAIAPAAHALDPLPSDYASWHSVDTPGGGAWTVTSDQNGDIWYADDIAREVVHLVPGTSGKTVYPLGLSATRIVSMAATPDGHIWLGDAGAEVLRRLDPATGAVDNFPLAGRFPWAPVDIAVDQAGDIWFGGWNGAADPGLTMIRPDGTVVTVKSPMGHMIEQIAVAPDGRVWFTEDASSALHVYDPLAGTYSTVSLGAITSGGSWDATDVAVSTSGDIWAATDKGVAKVAPSGALLTVTPYATGSLPVTPRSMVAGEFAEMYFVDGNGGLVRIDAAGNATFFSDPYGSHSSNDVAVDRFGAVWTTLDGAHLGWV
jgi:streptogramin lyase